jgi:hypothetical protein
MILGGWIGSFVFCGLENEIMLHGIMLPPCIPGMYLFLTEMERSGSEGSWKVEFSLWILRSN